jgi:hypothetical protein
MSDFDLLKTVQATDGWFAVVGIKGKSVRQKLVETREEVDQLVQYFVQNGYDAYFGLAKFTDGSSRQKHNVHALKAFWLDIDCGESKAEPDPDTGIPDGYIDQQAALQALRTFCKTTGLPKPTLVNSGRGVHVYWPLTEEVTREQWEPVAFKLRELCVEHKFYVDAAVFEVSRILRVPNTLNFKDEPPKPVEVLSVADPVDFGALLQILNVELNTQGEQPPKREMSALMQSMVSASVNKFSKIMRRSAKGDGCQQLLSCYQDRAELAEPRWFDALSVAKFCDDRDKAIHTLSEGYPGYNPAETEQKIQHIIGPHTCEKFAENNPGGCEGCPFKGKIKSPIVLGREIEEAESNEIVETDEDGEPEVHHIPEYPRPFFRGKNGGVYFLAEEESDPICVYEHDLYVVKRMRDPIVGDVVVMKLHLPRDGVQEFVVPNTHMAEPSELKKTLSKHGVLTTKKKFELLITYLMTAVKELQFKRKAEQMRLQFGWADNHSKFIVGDREITVDGTFHSPPSSVTSNIAKHLHPVGSFEKWKEVFSLYGAEGLEPHAFAAATAFGSPLLHCLGQNGAIINVIHNSSGTGKTTILHMCNSVWGHPEHLCGTWQDTLNAKILRLGVMNNLPFTIDEMTNTSPADFSTLVYNMSQGRGKDRVKAQANELRQNLTSWQNISLASSNASFYEKLGSHKDTPDGEMMRLLEYKIDYTTAIDPAYAKQMFDHQLKHNFGHAGLIYADYLVKNYEEVKNVCLATQARIDAKVSLTQRERFWSAVMAANITGLRIAKHLGLIDWDIKRIVAWATTDMLNSLREEVKPPVTDVAAIIGDYINRKMAHILVVNDQVDARSNMASLPVLEPRGELLIRYEPDTKRMYFAAKAFKNDCVTYQVNYKDTLSKLEANGVFIGAQNKRLSKGMKVTSPAVHCLIFDCTNSEFLDMDDFVRAETEDAGGES